jgi:hypothetical protein
MTSNKIDLLGLFKSKAEQLMKFYRWKPNKVFNLIQQIQTMRDEDAV